MKYRIFGARGAILVASTLALLAGCSSPRTTPGVEITTMPMGTAKYTPGESPFAVGAIPEAVLHDASRNKDVSMSIEYPGRGGPYPVIVFSHAYGSSKDAYVTLTEYWVGHGYVCIKPSHADANAIREAFMPRPERGAQRGRESRRNRSAVEVTKEPPQPAPEERWKSATPADWEGRARDVDFVIDSIPALEQKYPELAGKIDRTKIGVGGDNYGAFTAMLVAGMTSFKTNPPLHPANSQVRALLAMSPQGVSDIFGLTPQSWADVKIPAMFITGSQDRGLGENGDPKWRHDPFGYSPAGDKYFVSFNGASDRTFSGQMGPIADSEVYRRPQTDAYGRPVASPEPMQRRGSIMSGGRILGSIEMATIGFWDAYLKGDPNAKEYLNDPAFNSLNGGGVTVERK